MDHPIFLIVQQSETNDNYVTPYAFTTLEAAKQWIENCYAACIRNGCPSQVTYDIEMIDVAT